jgi:acetyl esterase/lipase
MTRSASILALLKKSAEHRCLAPEYPYPAALDDSTRFAERAKEAGVDVALRIGKGLFHCYPVCAPLFPEATQAMAEICAFIREHIGRGGALPE